MQIFFIFKKVILVRYQDQIQCKTLQLISFFPLALPFNIAKADPWKWEEVSPWALSHSWGLWASSAKLSPLSSWAPEAIGCGLSMASGCIRFGRGGYFIGWVPWEAQVHGILGERSPLRGRHAGPSSCRTFCHGFTHKLWCHFSNMVTSWSWGPESWLFFAHLPFLKCIN